VLCIPSLQIAAGEKVAIIAEDTAGKSTLARLLTRFYDAIRENISLHEGGAAVVLPLLSRQNRHSVRTIGICRKHHSCVLFGRFRLRRPVDRIA
jgi:ABC-type transport system involved in Fe-S cluster assembly fused permease/ATPase subunit